MNGLVIDDNGGVMLKNIIRLLLINFIFLGLETYASEKFVFVDPYQSYSSAAVNAKDSNNEDREFPSLANAEKIETKAKENLFDFNSSDQVTFDQLNPMQLDSSAVVDSSNLNNQENGSQGLSIAEIVERSRAEQYTYNKLNKLIKKSHEVKNDFSLLIQKIKEVRELSGNSQEAKTEGGILSYKLAQIQVHAMQIERKTDEIRAGLYELKVYEAERLEIY